MLFNILAVLVVGGAIRAGVGRALANEKHKKAIPTPNHNLFVGTKNSIDCSQSAYAYLETSGQYAACDGTVILKGTENPCEHPFTLSDGITYTWHGCGGNTDVTWGNGDFLRKLCVYTGHVQL